ncbi:MBOAT family O-acyltransferase [Limobrevibacterium gyesilva]|uniref:Probable alginate O-acetylase AlgI n=1 Tax=Limobrevibacterium gyesilva TaxID=2991712 RepID=A0AA41YSE9_9PROT|nr:MBOAT family O-acyltransferase [Limobrevibacterium gyesilva]MCW3475660.1 MBOAT family protein [Limobrevibacterium gyesilva]
MLFNSYAFIFGFLPVTLLGFFLLGRRSALAAATWLALASVVFYAWWDWHFSFVLLASILLNYAAGRILAARAAAGSEVRWPLLLAVGANLLALGYYKYMGFFAVAAAELLRLDLPVAQVALPIGISFFTFTQIAFLVDAARGRVSEPSFVHYLLFVTYFPHLIAGPVLHHAEMIPQFRRKEAYAPREEAIAVGLTVFLLGLFKKVVLADEVAVYANAAFAPGHAPSLGCVEAWGGTLAYTLQIYFDFSAYSDMAVGLSRLFNIRLPANFESPYQACSVIDFWRRWHITLSRFLRDYLYIPLGGNRRGRLRRHANLMATMVLGGLWHGAGWTFLIWGALHGFYLMLNHAWRHACSKVGIAPGDSIAGRIAGWAVTFLAVMMAWVFFRAPDLQTAFTVLRAMAGLQGIAPPVAMDAREILLLTALSAIALLAPNIRQIMGRNDLVLGPVPATRPDRRLQWRPGVAWATACFGMFVVSLLQMTRVSQFLYFQF